ncbi:MAG: TonB-dependent receptor plug domain-containing protein [Treponema sp.]|nr:TonB-dependent receptor plug domain-containing protein [Treponema sp.]
MGDFKFSPFFFLLFSAAAVFCAEVSITVVDQDLGIPLEGARIVSWDDSETFCNTAGKAFIFAPDDRTVVVQISYPGYESSRLALRPGTVEYTAALRLGGIREERELVIEASRPGSSETVSGRSVAISGRELSRPAETGFVEDVMRAVKLLPGVGYIGGYMAMPSIRGGEPSDTTAVFDGFYVERPFHWDGAFSIFDPKMVESAQLSHGVFSARYGHTISGLLDIRAKTPSGDTAEVDLAVSTSAANLNLSFPLDRGGIFLMGRVTYWDPFVAAAKIFYEEVRYISTAPYIRSFAMGASYDFTTDLSFSANGFFGFDGVGAFYKEDSDDARIDANLAWDNKIGFLTSALHFNPGKKILLKTRLGAGFLQSDLGAKIDSENKNTLHTFSQGSFFTDRTINVQGRIDLDWDAGKGFIVSTGVEERYSRWDRTEYYSWNYNGDQRPSIDNNVMNHGMATALYGLFEYKSENRRFGMELGLRGDHFRLSGKDFVLKGIPSVNPRLNLDFGILEEKGVIDALSFTVGTGFFSSVNNDLQNISSRNDIGEYAATQNRSWTSVLGTKIDFTGGYVFTLEGYFKHVFNRAYTLYLIDPIEYTDNAEYFFDGKALIWGFDCMLQKFSSRLWDGWVSYSFIDARYKDPKTKHQLRNLGDWYYPRFHRFHTLNVIFNYKPVPAVHLTTRFSLASGMPIPKTVAIREINDPPGIIPYYERIQKYEHNSRAGLVIPLDVKLSFFNFYKQGKVRREIYVSFENLLSLVYKPEGFKDFDRNTGKETASTIASYDLPIPLVTFGIKWSY